MDETHKMSAKWLKRIFKRRPIELAPAAVATITEQQLEERFLNAPGNPLFMATLAALDLQVQEDLNDCLEENLTNDQMRYRIGGVAGLLKFKAGLEDREREARRTQQEIEAQARREKEQG